MPTFPCCSSCNLSCQFKFPQLKNLLKTVLSALFTKLPAKISIPLPERWTPSPHKKLLPISSFEMQLKLHILHNSCSSPFIFLITEFNPIFLLIKIDYINTSNFHNTGYLLYILQSFFTFISFIPLKFILLPPLCITDASGF